MFVSFFYHLREAGIPASPTAFLRLQEALARAMVSSVEDLYVASRALLVKHEKYFDRYDQVFAHVFSGASLPNQEEAALDFWARAMLDEWLRDPRRTSGLLGENEQDLNRLSPEELLDYFKQRLREQKERHDGGPKWIGTGGTSPVGHSGQHPGGLRIGGISLGKTALQIAGERRYRDYALEGHLRGASFGEALKRLRNLVPRGVRDQLNVDASIRKTIDNGGEIELVFDRGEIDRLKVILAIDNGGWSMEPYVELVQTLFDQARSQFRDLRTLYFHNTIYDQLWEDPARWRRPVTVERLIGEDPQTRLIIVGDASMAPYELMAADGSIYAGERSARPSHERLVQLAESLPFNVWLNPVSREAWQYTRTIGMIATIFPMFELTLEGIEKAVERLQQGRL